MPIMSPVSEPIQKHVPAWKKLGLKLKFAKEEPEDIQPSRNGTVDGKKRKAPAQEEAVAESPLVGRSTKRVKKSKLSAEEAEEAINGNGHQDEEKPRKKAKKSDSSIGKTAEDVNSNKDTSHEPANAERASKKVKSKVKTGKTDKTDASTISVNSKVGGTNGQPSSPPPTLKTTPASKAKSVSFTPDTKTKDGDSVKSLYKTWIAKQIATDPSFDPSTVSPTLRSIIPSILPSPESPSPLTSTSISTSEPTTTSDGKKPTKKPKTRLPKISSGPSPSRFDPVLTYLTTHHTSPQTWKFSKPHQNQILKHLFSLSHIPSSYDTALLPYIRGLKGTSARSRVRKEALAVRGQDDKWLASEEPLGTKKMENETAAQCNARRRRDYEAAVARFKQTLEEREDEREDRASELLGENSEWEERFLRRKRAEDVLWSVGEADEAVDTHNPSSRQDLSGGNDDRRIMDSGKAPLKQAVRDAGPAPRVGRGVGIGMGGVEVIDAGGIAKGSRGKKVVFAQDGAARAGGTDGGNGLGGTFGAGQANGVKTPDSGNGANGTKPLRKRKRRTGVPDDDDSSSSSGRKSSDESEKEQPQPQKRVMDGGGAGTSSSSSDTSWSGYSDSD